MICIKANKNWYWEQTHKQKFIVVPTHKIYHNCIDVIVVKYVQDTPKTFCNTNQEHQASKRRPICINESNHEYILDESFCRYQIEHEININIENTAD